MLAAAFPRQSWRAESEAVYVMALTAAGIDDATAKAAIGKLVLEEMELPPVALVLRRCREVSAAEILSAVCCQQCGSGKIAGSIGAAAVCFDCDWEGTL